MRSSLGPTFRLVGETDTYIYICAEYVAAEVDLTSPWSTAVLHLRLNTSGMALAWMPDRVCTYIYDRVRVLRVKSKTGTGIALSDWPLLALGVCVEKDFDAFVQYLYIHTYIYTLKDKMWYICWKRIERGGKCCLGGCIAAGTGVIGDE